MCYYVLLRGEIDMKNIVLLIIIIFALLIYANNLTKNYFNYNITHENLEKETIGIIENFLTKERNYQYSNYSYLDIKKINMEEIIKIEDDMIFILFSVHYKEKDFETLATLTLKKGKNNRYKRDVVGHRTTTPGIFKIINEENLVKEGKKAYLVVYGQNYNRRISKVRAQFSGNLNKNLENINTEDIIEFEVPKKDFYAKSFSYDREPDNLLFLDYWEYFDEEGNNITNEIREEARKIMHKSSELYDYSN